MNQSIQWDAETFKEDIGFLISNFNSIFLSDVVTVLNNPNGNRIESLKALISIDLAKLHMNLHEILGSIERELKSNAKKLIFMHSRAIPDVIDYLDRNFYHGFIKSQLINELNATLNQLKELTALAASHLHILEINSGFSGVIRGLHKGYSDPIDGVSHLFGYGSMQIEVDFSVQGFNTAAAFVGQLIDSVSKLLQQIVLTKWNQFGAMLEIRAGACPTT